MEKFLDISTTPFDEVERQIEAIDPDDVSVPFPRFEADKREPPPKFLTDAEMFPNVPIEERGTAATGEAETPKFISDEEMFPKMEMRAMDKAWLLLDKPLERYEKIQSAVGSAAWKGLGILAWPFQRIEFGLATPAESIIRTTGPLGRIGQDASMHLVTNNAFFRSKYKNEIRNGLTDYAKAILGDNLEPMLEDMAQRVGSGHLTHEKVMANLNEAKSASEDILPSLFYGAKSFIPFTRNDPEKVKNFNDFWAAYYEEITGESAPEWYNQVSGISTSYLVTPLVYSRLAGGIKEGLKKLPMVQKLINNQLPEWKDAMLLRRANIFERTDRATRMGRALADKEATRIAKQLSLQYGRRISKDAVKLRMGQIIKGSITQEAVLQPATSPVIQEFKRNFDELTRLGILSNDTFLTKLTRAQVAAMNAEKAKLVKQLERVSTGPHYVGTQELSAKFPGRAKRIQELQSKIDAIDDKIYTSTHIGGELYMPRMYRTKEAEIAARKAFPVAGGPKVRAGYAKARQDIPEEVRKAMGEIKQPAYPVTKRLIQEAQDIETQKLFEFAAQRGDWVDDVWRAGLAKRALPDSKQYGPLAGKYVKEKIYNDVMELTRIRSGFESLYDSIIGSWKVGKVILSPSTHFRNTFCNIVQLDLSGVGPAKQSQLFVKAIKEIRKNSDEWKSAQKFFGQSTLGRGEFYDDLLKTVSGDKAKGLQRVINGWNRVFSKATRKPAEIYQGEEVMFKFMKFLEQREKGKSVMGAVKEANKYMFDYSDLSRFEKTVMRRVMPFYTYPRKALPMVLEASIENPYGLAKYPIAFWAIEKYSLERLDIADDEYAKIQKQLPDYMRQGSYMLLPFRDANEDLLFLDLTYLLPWGEMLEAQSGDPLKNLVSNPLVQLHGDIVRNKSAFTGREIWMETDTLEEQTFKKMTYVWQAAAPSLSYRGIYWDKLYNAATGLPYKSGKVPPLAPAVAHTLFGLRTQAIDPDMQSRYNMMDTMDKLRELGGKIADIVQRANVGNITEEEYNRRRDRYINQIQSILAEQAE